MGPVSVKSDDTKFILRVANEIGVERVKIVDVVHLSQCRNENNRF